MLRPVRRLTAVLLGLSFVVSGCGGTPDPEKVRAVVETFGRASAAKDYQRICETLLAPKLVEEVERVGLPCEQALQRGLGQVRSPQLTIGRIDVDDDKATVQVRTAAAGELPSEDELELVRFGDGWRIASLS
jgi:hypothetical protein